VREKAKKKRKEEFMVKRGGELDGGARDQWYDTVGNRGKIRSSSS